MEKPEMLYGKRESPAVAGVWPPGGGRPWMETIGEMETIGPDSALLAGRYRAVRRLGEGGMGSVWLAEDQRLDGRLVALKMLPAVLAGRKIGYRQVKREALLSMRLAHPNIVTVRGFEEEAGNPFLVMDYIAGKGLDELLADRGALGETETLRLLGQVAAALDYAHREGVLHRDVKPGNVMVDREGKAYVLDFGIAREIQETVTQITGKASSGTVLYMSPEQLHGRTPKASQDVYSFAAMAYECLGGSPPFARGQLEWQIDHDAPPELAPHLGSERLRRGIMAGLSKDPALRPGTCAEVLGIGDGARAAEPARPAAESTDRGTVPTPPKEEAAPPAPQTGQEPGKGEPAAGERAADANTQPPPPAAEEPVRRRTRWKPVEREEMERWLRDLEEAGVVTAGEAAACRGALSAPPEDAAGRGLSEVARYFANWDEEKEDPEGAALFAGKMIRTLCAAATAPSGQGRPLGPGERDMLRRFRVAVSGGREEELEGVEVARTEAEAVCALDALALGWLEAYGRVNALGRGTSRPVGIRISTDGQALATDLRHVEEWLRSPLQGALLRTLNAGLSLGGRI